MYVLQRFWNDEHGVIDVTTSMLIFTMLIIGSLVGFSAFRVNLIQEFGDLSQSLEALDQSYSYTVNNVTSQYSDDFLLGVNQTPGNAPAGLDVQVEPTADSE